MGAIMISLHPNTQQQGHIFAAALSRLISGMSQ
jgi:hypothetical protein